jgi:hypothetical protein
MTTYPPEPVSDRPSASRGRVPPRAAPEAADLAFGLMDALSGAGLVFMSFLAVIPGLLPAVILAALLIAPLLIPLFVVGAAAVLLLGVVRVAAWALSFAASPFVQLAPARRSVPAPPEDLRVTASPVVPTGS